MYKRQQYERAIKLVRKKYPHSPFKPEEAYEDNLLDLPQLVGYCDADTYAKIRARYDGHGRTEHDGTTRILIWDRVSNPHGTMTMDFLLYIHRLLGDRRDKFSWAGRADKRLTSGIKAPDEQGVPCEVRQRFEGPDEEIPSTLVLDVNLNLSSLDRTMKKCHTWLSDYPHLQVYFSLGAFCRHRERPGMRIVFIYAKRSGAGFELNTYEIGTYVPQDAPPTPESLEIPVKLLFHGDPDYENSEEILYSDMEKWKEEVKSALRLK